MCDACYVGALYNIYYTLIGVRSYIDVCIQEPIYLGQQCIHINYLYSIAQLQEYSSAVHHTVQRKIVRG